MSRAGVLAAVVAAAVGFRGLSGLRDAYSYDEALTVAWFVKAPTAIDAVTRQAVFNNHPLISLLDHLVYEVTGSHSPAVMRIVPLLALSLSAALLAYVAARRWGVWQGALAAALLATNPLITSEGRLVRGYALLLLFAEMSAVLLVWMRDGGRSRWREAALMVVLALGVLAHLYMLLVIAIEAVFVWRTPALRHARIVVAAAAGVAIGLSIQVPLLVAGSSSGAGRDFQPGFPLSLARSLLGTEWLAVSLGGLLAATALLAWRHNRLIVWLTATAAAEVLVVWMVAPLNLYTRFFVWLVPAVAVAVVVGARRWQRALPHRWSVLAWLACGAILVVQAGSPAARLGTDNAVPDVLPILHAVQDAGGTVCLVRGSWPLVAPYFSAAIVGPEVPEACDLVASLSQDLDQPYLDPTRARYRNLVVVPAGIPATLFTNHPPGCVDATPPPDCWGR